MHKTLTSKSPTSNETKCNINVASKLRRLKIEENLLLQNLKKFEQKRKYEVSESDKTNDVAFKNTIKNLKDSYIHIKNLFDDIKIVTSSQELLAELEIDEIKKKVLELETNMRSFKLYLSTELNTVKSAEKELMKQLEEINFKANMKRAKISSENFKQAVPSPVRLIMTSPLKYTVQCYTEWKMKVDESSRKRKLEVQEFQDFMKNSPNRYGGWNEYHHNIFVKLWQKHFGNVADTQYNDDISLFDSFVEESLFKLQSIDKKSLLSHIDWYKKFLFFKSNQQMAIDKWKSNKRSLIKVPDDNHMHHSIQNEFGNVQQPKSVQKKHKLELSKPIEKNISKQDIERITAPTKQWLSRCEYEPKSEKIPFIENLDKLKTPNWRQYL